MRSVKSLSLLGLLLLFSQGVLCQESGGGLGPIDSSGIPEGGMATAIQASPELQFLADSSCQTQLFDPSVIFHFDTIYNWACGGNWNGAPVDSTNGPTDHQRQLALDLSFYDKSDSGSVYVELHNLTTGNGINVWGSCYDGFALTGVMVEAPGVLSVDLDQARPGQEVCYGDCSNPEPLCQLEGWDATVDDNGFSMFTSGCPSFGLVSFGNIWGSTRIRNGFLVELEVDDSFTMDSLTVEIQFGCGQQTIVPMNYSSWGCTDDNACNFDAGATIDDDSCLFPTCDDASACNFDPQAVCGGGECIPSGCRESDACNFDPEAQCDGEECDYSCCPGPGCCNWPLVWNATTQQCLLAEQTCGEGTTWDEFTNQCMPADLCLADLDNDGVIGMSDLMDVLSRFGIVCPDSELWQNLDGMNGATNQAESDSCATACCPGPGCCAAPAYWDSETQMCVILELACGEGTYWNESLGQCLPLDMCFADLNFDGEVGMADLLVLLPSFGVCPEEVWHCGDPLEYQGYDYETVQIGEQCWFKENLRSEAYANGDMIPSAGSAEEFAQLSEGAKVVYGEWEGACSHDEELFDACNPSESLEAYGYLYNWHTTSDDRGICPSGWSVPSQEDWGGLFNHLGGNAVAGEAMKTSEGWAFDGGGSNVSGFDAVPGSQHNTANAAWESAGAYGFWWSRTSTSLDEAWGLKLSCFVDKVYDSMTPKSLARSIRCLQDSE